MECEIIVNDRRCEEIRLALDLSLELLASELSRRLGRRIGYFQLRRFGMGISGYRSSSKQALLGYCTLLADKAADAHRHDLQMPPWDMCPSDFQKPQGAK